MAFHVELRTAEDLELDEDDELRQQIEDLYGKTRLQGSQREEMSFDFLYDDFPDNFLNDLLGERLCGEAIGLFCEFEPIETDFEYIYPMSLLVSRIEEKMPDVAAIAKQAGGLDRIYAKVETKEWDMRQAFAGCILDLCYRPGCGQPIFLVRW